MHQIKTAKWPAIVALFGLILLIIDGIALVESAALDDSNIGEAKATAFLIKYGYIEKNKAGASSMTPEILAQAITEYQQFYGLNETGVLDEETAAQMEVPRCANPDKRIPGEATNFFSNFSSEGGKPANDEQLERWQRFQLTYRLLNYPRLFSTRQKEVDEVIERALKSWSAVSKFTFTKTSEDADIQFKWDVGKHCESVDFDGPLKILAHAFYPQSGRVHFDDEENWSLSGPIKGKIDLFTVALHELGHTLGLDHLPDREAIMFANYPLPNKPQPVDIAALQKIYDVKKASPPPPSTTASPPVPQPVKRPNLCKDTSFDAITMSNAKKVFIFKGAWYWQLNDDADEMLPGYPRPISKDWNGLPDSVDAAVTFRDGKFYFFKGDRYWRFTNRRLDAGYPKLISVGFPGIPNNVDAAFFNNDDSIIFFKGGFYWRFDWRDSLKVKPVYPKLITEWPGVPVKLNSVFKWKNGVSYFFKDEFYYRYDDENDKVDSSADPPFPRLTSEWWLSCDRRLTSDVQGGQDQVENDTSEFKELEFDLNNFQSPNGTEVSTGELHLD